MAKPPGPAGREPTPADSDRPPSRSNEAQPTSNEQHLAFVREVGRSLLTLADNPELIAYDTTGTAVKRVSEAILQSSYDLRDKQVEDLKPNEQQLVLLKSRTWPFGLMLGSGLDWDRLSDQDQAVVQARGRGSDLEKLAKEAGLNPVQIATVVAVGSDRALESLIDRYDLGHDQSRQAFARGGPLTRRKLLQQKEFRLTASERQQVLDDDDDRNTALLVRRHHHYLTKQQWQQALIQGGDETLSEMTLQGRLKDADDRLVALVRGGDETLAQLVDQNDLSPDELTIAIYLGGQLTLTRLVDHRQQLNKKQLALVRMIAARRRMRWLVETLDREPGPDETGGPETDPGSGPSQGPGSAPVGSRPGGSPLGSLVVGLDFDDSGGWWELEDPSANQPATVPARPSPSPAG